MRVRAIEVIIDGIIIYVGFKAIKLYGKYREIRGIDNYIRAMDKVGVDFETRDKVAKELKNIYFGEDKEEK